MPRRCRKSQAREEVGLVAIEQQALLLDPKTHAGLCGNAAMVLHGGTAKIESHDRVP